MGIGKNGRKKFYMPKKKYQKKVNVQTAEQITGVYVPVSTVIFLFLVKFQYMVAVSGKVVF